MTMVAQASQLAVAMESDVQDGKTFKEHEHEFYVEIEDFEQLKKAQSVDLQEQWNLKIDKIPGNAAKGALRIRQIYAGDLQAGPGQKPTGDAQYVLTTKINQGVGRRLEVPVPTTEDAFELFAMLSDSGMIKHRYHFPVGELVFEVDMFLNPEGGYYPIAKIDLEVKNLSGEIPELPIAVKSCIKGDTKDEAEKKKISEYYDKYFISKNRYLKGPDNVATEGYEEKLTALIARRKGLSVAQEDAFTVIGGGFLALLAVANLFIWGQEKWTNYVKKKNASIDVFDEEVRNMVKTLQTTFLNDGWLKKQTFKTGTVKVPGGAQWLSVGGRFNPNVEATVNATLQTIDQVRGSVNSAYAAYSTKVNALAKPIADILLAAPPAPHGAGRESYLEYVETVRKPENEALYVKVEKQLRSMDHPMKALWSKLPNAGKMIGGLTFSVNEKYTQFDGEYHFKVTAKPVSVATDLPALDATRAKAIAELIIKVLNVGHLKAGRMFDDATKAVYRLPSPQDGWPYAPKGKGGDIEAMFGESDTGEEFFDTMLYVMGSWGEQGTDPLFELEGAYYYILSSIAESLYRWLGKSIEGKERDSGDHEYRGDFHGGTIAKS